LDSAISGSIGSVLAPFLRGAQQLGTVAVLQLALTLRLCVVIALCKPLWGHLHFILLLGMRVEHFVFHQTSVLLNLFIYLLIFKTRPGPRVIASGYPVPKMGNAANQ